MRRFLRWIPWTLVLALALPVLAADDKDAKDKKKDPDQKKDAKDKKKDAAAELKTKPEKISYGARFIAKLTKVEGTSQQDFTVQISIKYLEPNLQAQAQLLQKQQQLLLKQRQIMLTRNPFVRQQLLLQLIQQAQGQPQNLYNVKEIKKDIDLRAAEDMKVRTLQPPVEYDDKGNLKKYTPKELKELRGKGNLPGYTADFDSLREGQIVKVYLAKPKAKPKKKVEKKDKKGKKDKKDKKDMDDEDEDLDQPKPEALMVVVIKEPPEMK
jgi:hypothetical protein